MFVGSLLNLGLTFLLLLSSLVGGSGQALLVTVLQNVPDVSGQTWGVEVVVAGCLGEVLPLVEVFITDGTGAVRDVALSQAFLGKLLTIQDVKRAKNYRQS